MTDCKQKGRHRYTVFFGDDHWSRKQPDKLARGDDHWSNKFPERITKGEAQGMAKLTEESVREIRRLYATGEYSQRKLAKQFGVAAPTIIRAVRRETWRHVI
jgi:hypothetical protein